MIQYMVRWRRVAANVLASAPIELCKELAHLRERGRRLVGH